MRRLRDGSARENKRYRFVAEGGSNRREGGSIYTLEKGYISLECKREEHAEGRREDRGRESDRRRSDEDSPGVAGEEQHGMENEGETGKASDETNELDGRRRRLDQREKDEKL